MVWSCDEKRRLLCHKRGPKYEDDGKETERKAQVRVDQQHQQPPGEKEHQPQRCNKKGTVHELYRTEEVGLGKDNNPRLVKYVDMFEGKHDIHATHGVLVALGVSRTTHSRRRSCGEQHELSGHRPTNRVSVECLIVNVKAHSVRVFRTQDVLRSGPF